MTISIRWILIPLCLFISIASVAVVSSSFAEAKEGHKLLLTVLTASNEGDDFDLDNDEYRDRLIQLFSYRSYKQENQEVVTLSKTERQVIPLIDGYELVLMLQDEQKYRLLVQAVIMKEGVPYVNTVLSILEGGAAFIGGPNTGQGALILALERT